MARIPPARGPNEWPDAQRMFMQGVLAGADAPSQDVWIRWWTKQPSPIFGFRHVVGLALTLVTGLVALGRWLRRGPQGTWVVVWLAASPTGSLPDLMVKIDPGVLPGPSGDGNATLLGEAAPNGGLCLVVDGRRAAPIFNPLAPSGLLLGVAGVRA